MKRTFLTGLVICTMLLLGACAPQSSTAANQATGMVTMYKDPNCGCCVGHAKALEDAGYEVDIKPVSDMDAIKDRYDIPQEMRSCHTSIIDGYVVEGHVPIETINRLRSERPDVQAIALPRMPSGSPGMPGPKRGDFVTFSLDEDGWTEYDRR